MMLQAVLRPESRGRLWGPALLLLALANACASDAASETAPPTPTAGPAAGDVPAAWWAQVQRGLSQENYRISERDGVLGADNAAQGWLVTFEAPGLVLGPLPQPAARAGVGPAHPGETEAAGAVPPWALRLHYAGIARASAEFAADEPGATTPTLGRCVAEGANGVTGDCLRQVEYAHDPAVVEFFQNDRRAVAQGFVLAERPAGDGELAVWVRYEGLRARAEGDAIVFAAGGHDRVKVSGLVVRDAAGRSLPARLELAAGALRLAIDDREASYPIVINALATAPSWTATGEAPGDGFAFAVASAGDVNGDGYGDVIVGANGYAAYTGRAYLFLGAPTGLAATAAWTKTGEGSYHDFGAAVASAGDVNDDGYADVLVGAPRYASSTGRAYLFLGSAAGLEATASWTQTGETGDTALGYSVASAGDVNGDGYSDVIVGAYRYGSYAGRAYVFHGGAAGLAPTANWTKTGEAAYDEFGYAVASAGDVNGDGYSDVIVGAEGHAYYTGRTYVFHGSATGLGSSANWTKIGEASNNNFGSVVASAGDVNGDGYADVIVGAMGYSSSTGRAYVFHGAAGGLAATAAWTKTGDAAGDYFAWALGPAGDVNGDGMADVVVAAPFNSSATGRAYVFHGAGAGLATTAGWTSVGEAAGDFFGWAAAAAGDVNGDGFGDVIVGAYPYASGTGRAYVFLGAAGSPSATWNWTKTGQGTSDNFGVASASAGDVNGDGFSDVIIGAPNYNAVTGRAYLFLGSAAGLPTSANWIKDGEVANNDFGGAVASAGDVNGDGYADVVIGAFRYNAYQGRAYLFLGGPAGLSYTPSWTATGEATGNYFGLAVASAGDVNGDGFADVLVGATSYSSNTGRAYLYHGGPTGLSATANWIGTGETTATGFGESLASAGDVNGDGFADVVVGAHLYANSTGRAYVYLGGAAGLATTPSWTKTGEGTSNRFGGSVASAGDVNGDGYGDVIVGAPNAASWVGRAYLYHGGPAGLATTAQWIKTGESSMSSLGDAVASAGDVNADGYGDVIIGADGYSSFTGRAYVFLGGAAGLATTASWTQTGEAVNHDFGYPVASAGDVNGDGFADVIVGADGFYSHEGKAYLAFGNGAGALSQNPRQGHHTLTTLLQPGGIPDFIGIKLKLGKRTTVGRSKVKLQYEIKAHTAPLDGTGLALSPSWTDSGLPGSPLADLTHEATAGIQLGRAYHWRARLVYQTGGWSRWFYFGVGLAPVAFRFPRLADGADCTDGSECLSAACVDGVCCAAATCPDCQACNVAGYEGECHASAAGTTCDDGLYCNGSDSCDGAGVCAAHTGDPCPAPAFGVDRCAAACDEAAAACTGNAPSAAPCGSSTDDACTAPDGCDGAGVCLTNDEAVGTACDNGVFCDGGDRCDGAGACAVHLGDPCPAPAFGVDRCAAACDEAAAACTGHAPVAAPCGSSTDDACTAADGCDGAGVCLPNDAALGTSCDNGVFCDGGDGCDGAGACAVHTGDPCAGPDGDTDCNESCNEPAGDCSLYDGDGVPCLRGSCQGGGCLQCLHGGDVTGDGLLSSGDAQRAFLIALGSESPDHDPPWTPWELCAADCNGDGTVSSGDAQIIFLGALGVGGCVDPL